MWKKKENQIFSRGGLRVGVLIEGYCEFLRLVTFNTIGLIPQLERRDIIFNNIKVEFLFDESYQIS